MTPCKMGVSIFGNAQKQLYSCTAEQSMLLDFYVYLTVYLTTTGYTQTASSPVEP